MTAVAMRQKGLKPAAKIVLYWLADHHNGETGQCNPSINRLARCCEMSRRSVENQLQVLQDAKLIKITNKHREQGGKTANSYSLCMTESDAQNLRMGSAKSAHGDTQNLRMKNLVTNNLGKKPVNNMLNEPSFDDFWDVVPIKKGKGDARKAWGKAIRKTSPQAIVDAMRKYAEHVKANKTDDCWIKHPSGWLNGERWGDDLGEVRGQRGNNFLDKFKEQLKGTDDDNGLFQAHSNDTKRIG